MVLAGAVGSRDRPGCKLTLVILAMYPCTMCSAWITPKAAPDLADDEVHVWRLDLEDAVVDAACLSPDERGRAESIATERHRRHFVAGRFTLRCLLAQYLGCEPAGLAFAYGEHGKPALQDGDLSFNMSHSHRMACYAVARARAVGVDVEWPRPGVAHEQIAERFFSLEEREALSAVVEGDKKAAFYNIWTRKEAYIKARGDGITAGLDTFGVSLGAEAALVHSDEGQAELARWRLQALDPASGYVAALCAEGAWRLRCLRCRA